MTLPLEKQEKTLSSDEAKVLEILVGHTRPHGELCIAFGWIVSDTNLPLKQVRTACRSLRAKGFAEFYSGLMTDEGEVAGSGYCATPEGQGEMRMCEYEYCSRKATHSSLDEKYDTCTEHAHPDDSKLIENGLIKTGV